MLLPSRVAGRTLGLRWPDLAAGRRLPDFGVGVHGLFVCINLSGQIVQELL